MQSAHGSSDGNGRRRQDHYVYLLLASAVVVLSLLLEVRADGRIELRLFPGRPLPHVCLARSFFEPGCPACGLTRSVIHLARGNWTSSISAHRLGWLFAGIILLQFPYRIAALRRRDDYLLGNLPRSVGLALVLLLIADWFLGLLLLG